MLIFVHCRAHSEDFLVVTAERVNIKVKKKNSFLQNVIKYNPKIRANINV